MVSNVVRLSDGITPMQACPPDATVIESLKRLLADAESGLIQGYRMAYIERDKTVGSACAGWYSPAMVGELFTLTQKTADAVQHTSTPP